MSESNLNRMFFKFLRFIFLIKINTIFFFFPIRLNCYKCSSYLKRLPFYACTWRHKTNENLMLSEFVQTPYTPWKLLINEKQFPRSLELLIYKKYSLETPYLSQCKIFSISVIEEKKINASRLQNVR